MPRWTARVTLSLTGPAIGLLDEAMMIGRLEEQGLKHVVITLGQVSNEFRTAGFAFTLDSELEDTAHHAAGNAAFWAVPKYFGQVAVMDAEVEVKPVPIHDTRPVEDIDL